MTAASLLRENRAFRNFFIGSIVSYSGSTTGLVALTFGVLKLGQGRALGVTLLTREVGVLLGVVLGGWVADRYAKRLALVGWSALQSLSQAGIAVLLSDARLQLGFVAALAAVSGLGDGAVRPCASSMLPEILSAEKLQQGNSVMGLAPRLTGVAGALLGGALVASLGASVALGFDALTFAVAAAFFISINYVRTDLPRSAVTLGNVLRDLREGLTAVMGRPWLVAMISCFAALQVLYFPPLLVLGPQIASHGSTTGPTRWSWLLACELLGGVIGSLWSGRLRVRERLPVAVLAMVPMGLELIALSIGTSWVVVCCVGAIAGLGLAVCDTMWFTTLQQEIPEQLLGRVSSVDWLGSSAMNPLGYAAVGLLTSRSSPESLVAVAGCLVCIILGLTALLPWLRIDRQARI